MRYFRIRPLFLTLPQGSLSVAHQILFIGFDLMSQFRLYFTILIKYQPGEPLKARDQLVTGRDRLTDRKGGQKGMDERRMR